MLLNLSIVKIAARDLLIAATTDELQDPDTTYTLPEGIDSAEELADTILAEDGEMVMYIMGSYIGSIGTAWHNSVELVFYHMGILDNEDNAADALSRLIMSCWGHGVGLNDYHSEPFDRANEILGKYRPEPMKTTPTHFDESESWTSDLIWPRLVERPVQE